MADDDNENNDAWGDEKQLALSVYAVEEGVVVYLGDDDQAARKIICTNAEADALARILTNASMARKFNGFTD